MDHAGGHPAEGRRPGFYGIELGALVQTEEESSVVQNSYRNDLAPKVPRPFKKSVALTHTRLRIKGERLPLTSDTRTPVRRLQAAELGKKIGGGTMNLNPLGAQQLDPGIDADRSAAEPAGPASVASVISSNWGFITAETSRVELPTTRCTSLLSLDAHRVSDVGRIKDVDHRRLLALEHPTKCVRPAALCRTGSLIHQRPNLIPQFWGQRLRGDHFEEKHSSSLLIKILSPNHLDSPNCG